MIVESYDEGVGTSAQCTDIMGKISVCLLYRFFITTDATNVSTRGIEGGFDD